MRGCRGPPCSSCPISGFLKQAELWRGRAPFTTELGLPSNSKKEASPAGYGNLYQLLEEPHRLVKTSSLLKRLGKDKNFLYGRLVHHHIIECGRGWQVLLGNCLMQMYGKCGLVEESQRIFNMIPNPDSYSWNILINVYGYNKGIGDARYVFRCMPFPNVVSWNVMITLLSSSGHGKEALSLFCDMQVRGIMLNDVTCIAAMEACTMLISLKEGKKIHAIIIGNGGYNDNILVGTSLINMYGECGCLQCAKSVFDAMSYRDVVTWTAMIGCLSQNGCNIQALEHFQKMESEGVPPNDITFICAMEACANLASLEEGQDIHTKITCTACEDEIKVSNALIDMYGKCGSLSFARSIFDKMLERDVISWTSIIGVYGEHGQGKKSLLLFEEMRKLVVPDEVTFLNVLTACNRSGLADDGKHWFEAMSKSYGIVPNPDHYSCMIDLLGKSGCIEEAQSLMMKMPFPPTYNAWMAFLGACRCKIDVKRAEIAACHLFESYPQNHQPYILLANLYTAAGMIEDASCLLSIMQSKFTKT